MDTGRGSSERTASVEKTVGIRDNVETDTKVPIIIIERDSVDRISQLPDDVIMQIFSFLTPRDIVATRALGKMWARISPVLKLNFKHFIENKAGEFFESYKNQGARVKTYSLNIPNPFNYSTHINDWLELVAKNDINVLHIRFGFSGKRFPLSFQSTSVSVCKDLVVLSLQNLSLKGLTFTTELHSLEELALENVELSDRCDSVISSFCNIRRLRLKYCLDLNHLCLSRLHRLEEVEIWGGFSKKGIWPWTESIIVNNSNVKKFVFHENYINQRRLIFQGCNNLEMLWLDTSIFLPCLPKEILLPEADEFPLLKKLVLRGRHSTGKKFKLDRSTLEVLHLYHVDGIEGAIIDTSRLHTFKFKGISFEPFLFTMNTGTLQKISLEFHEKCPIDATWFWNLNLFARDLSQDGVLSLHIADVIHLSRGSLEKFRGSPACKLKHIKVKDLHNLAPLSCKDLIDGLLWRFHPEAFTIIMAKEPREYIEVIQNHLENKIGAASECCTSATSRCWRHSLKRAEIELSSRVSKKRPYRDLVELKLKFQWDEDYISMGLLRRLCALRHKLLASICVICFSLGTLKYCRAKG